MKKFLLGSFVSLLIFFIACVTAPETGSKSFIITSEEQEAQLGRQAYQEVLQKEPLSSNARWNQILQRVGQRVASAANKPTFQWEFRLIESKTANAFCLPGGKVAVYTGIIPFAKNEAGLATVIGHEVAHATARHAGQRITAQFGTQVALAGIAAAMGGDNKSDKKRLIIGLLGVGATIGVTLPFSRANESEADFIGLHYMARAGYDPREAPAFWSRFGGEGGGGLAKYLSTHPASADRARALAQETPNAMQMYQASPQYGIGETF